MSYFTQSGRQLYDTWMQMVRNRENLGRTVLETLAHPQATPEQIQDAADKYKRITTSLREVQPKVVKALYGRNENRLAQAVQESLKRKRAP